MGIFKVWTEAACYHLINRGMVELPWDYAWSSCRHCALGEANELLSPNPWYEQMGAVAASRQERWREFLLGADAKEERIRRQDWLVGDGEFRLATCEERSRPCPPSRNDCHFGCVNP